MSPLTSLALQKATPRRLAFEKNEMIRGLHEEHEYSECFIAYTLARSIRVEPELIDPRFNASEKRMGHTLRAPLRGPGRTSKGPPKVWQEMLAEMIGTARSRVNFFMNKSRKLGFSSYNGEIHVNDSRLSFVLHD